MPTWYASLPLLSCGGGIAMYRPSAMRQVRTMAEPVISTLLGYWRISFHFLGLDRPWEPEPLHDLDTLKEDDVHDRQDSNSEHCLRQIKVGRG